MPYPSTGFNVSGSPEVATTSVFAVLLLSVVDGVEQPVSNRTAAVNALIRCTRGRERIIIAMIY
ncbi:hypothetical protein Aph02nite_76810 [Actinoplanes philippinensis]|nr:hypothetical protein Aph02nite_76810 [Actinoplanes philippinensis]